MFHPELNQLVQAERRADIMRDIKQQHLIREAKRERLAANPQPRRAWVNLWQLVLLLGRGFSRLGELLVSLGCRMETSYKAAAARTNSYQDELVTPCSNA
jgi:hypothetical protein